MAGATAPAVLYGLVLPRLRPSGWSLGGAMPTVITVGVCFGARPPAASEGNESAASNYRWRSHDLR